MKAQVSPVVIGIAVVIVLALCIFLFVRANNSYGPNQLPPPTDRFQPGYNAGGDRNAGPGNIGGQRPAPGAEHGAKP